MPGSGLGPDPELDPDPHLLNLVDSDPHTIKDPEYYSSHENFIKNIIKESELAIGRACWRRGCGGS